MSNLQETVQQVLKRLLNMETRIEGLHEENVELKKENAVIKKNLQHVEKRLVDTEIDNDRLKHEMDILPGRAKEFQKNIRHITGLRRVLSRSLVDRQNIPDLYEKVDDLGSRIDAIDGKTKTLEQLRDDYEQSVTQAVMGTPTGGLVTGQWVKMVCEKVNGTTGVLEETTGCLVPKREGGYFVGMKMCQDGDGEIYVRMRWDGDQGIGQAMVKTGCDGGLQSGVCVTVMHKD